MRAVALVVMATGVSGVVAQFVPRYGPLYAYVTALIIIAWLEGVVVGLVGAIAAAGAYLLLFTGAALNVRSLSIVVGLTAAVLLVVGMVRRARRPPKPDAIPPAASLLDGELPAVRAQLAEALAALYEVKRAREADAVAAADREARLCEQYEQETEHVQRAAASALEDVERVRAENEELRRRLEEERAANEHLDAVWGEKLQKIVAELATDHENDLGEAVAKREEARAEVRSLQMRIASLQPATAKPDAPRRPLVLVVHHDPAMRSISHDSLEKGGFETITAADGLEGLRLTAARKPDVVVADASMPKMDGRELCQLIKSNQETAGVKVVLLTTDERDEVSRELGPEEFLRRPVKFDLLKAVIEKLVGSA